MAKKKNSNKQKIYEKEKKGNGGPKLTNDTVRF